MAATTIPSLSILSIMRQVFPASLICSSWQCAPIEGIGRDCGIESDTPFWSCRGR